MGGTKSKETKTENTGEIANNIILNDTVEVHSEKDFIVQCLILCVLVIELLLYVYYKLRKNIKKQYISRRDINLQNI